MREYDAQPLSEELGEERTTHHRAAHRRDVVRPNRIRERSDEWFDALRVGEQRIEVEPERTVQPRLHTEVTAPPCDEIEQVGAVSPHRDRSGPSSPVLQRTRRCG